MSDLSGGDSEVSQERQAQWEAGERRIRGIETSYGIPIDPKVRGVVIGLNALGIETDHSCEGHMQEGKSPLPFIGITGSGTTLSLLRRFLDEFNLSRQVPDDIRLTAWNPDPNNTDDIVLANKVGLHAELGQPNDNLPACQGEIVAFGDFLKKRFLSSSPDP